jgi:hypothetical protein
LIRLEALPKGLVDPELEASLERALEYEGWREAETLYEAMAKALDGREPLFRARLQMDQARVLRRLGKEKEAAAKEAEAEALLGDSIEREAEGQSSVDALRKAEAEKKGFFSKLFGRS